jgi:RHS repeat-associated protein
MSLDERRDQLDTGLAGDPPVPAEHTEAADSEPVPDVLEESETAASSSSAESEPTPAQAMTWAVWGTMPWGSIGPLMDRDTFRRGIATPGMPFQATVAVTHTGYDTTLLGPAEWRDVAVSWRIRTCAPNTEPVEYDFGQVVSAPNHQAVLNNRAEAPLLTAELSIPDVDYCAPPGATADVYPVLRLLDDGSGEVDPEPRASMYARFHMVPELDSAALCAPVCSGTGGLTQPTSTRGAGVNTATGGYSAQFPDAQVSAAQAPFALQRSYSSTSPSSGALGTGWSLPWETSLTTGTSGEVVLREESGAQLTFLPGTGGTYTAPRGARSVLRATTDGWELDTPEHRTLRYDPQGRLSGITNRGRQQLSVAYESSRPSQLTDASGRQYQLSYTDGRLTRLTMPDGRFVRYGYTDGRLTTVRALDGAETTYAYDSVGNLAQITGPDGHTLLDLIYDTRGRVTEQTDAAGAVTHFDYFTSNGFDTTHTTTPSGGIWTDLYTGNVLVAHIDPFGNATDYNYDADLNLTAVQDPLGRYTNYTYNNAARLTSVSTGDSRASWTYDADGNVASATDGASRSVSYEYTTDGLLEASVDKLGNRTEFTYTDDGLPESVTTPRGNTTSFEYDAQGNQVAVVSPSGAREERTYDAAGRVLTITDPRGHASTDPERYTARFAYDDADRITALTLPGSGGTERYTYDAYGQVETFTDAAERTTSYAYDIPGRLEEVTRPGGATTAYAFDDAGNVASVTAPDGGRTSYTYDEADRPLTAVTARGNADGADPEDFTWAFGYDEAGQNTTVTDPLDQTTAYEYDADGRIVQTTDPRGIIRKTTYDRGGLVTTVVDGNNRVENRYYDGAGQLIRVNDRRGKNTAYAYDADGHLIEERTPTGATSTYTYSADGLLATVVDPRGNVEGADPASFTWSYSYDEAGLPTGLTDPLGHTQSTVYDERGLLTRASDPLGESTAYDYDVLGRLQEVTAPDGGTTTYAYDQADNVTSRTDANDHTTRYGYDPLGRLTSVTDPLERTRELAYDLEGNLVTERNARGHTTAYQVDALGRTTEAAYSDGTPTATLAYNATGQPVQVSDGTGTRHFTNLDGEGRPRTVTLPGGQGSMAYGYDYAGNITSLRTPNNQTTTYTYNDDGRMASQNIARGHKTDYGYDAAGNLTSVTSPTANGHTETRVFDPAGRLSTATTAQGAGVLSSWELTRDPNGQPLQVDATRSGEAVRQLFTYDDNGRLTQECVTAPEAQACPAGAEATTAYTYDQVGNRLTEHTGTETTTYAYDAADQLTTATIGQTSTAYTHDDDGNLTFDGTTTYTYDAPGRLTSAGTNEGTYTYTYDADGNRASASLDDQLQRTAVWDILHPLPQLAGEYDGTGSLTATYTYNPHGQVQTQNHTEAGFQQYHRDWHGSVADTTNTTGTPQHRYAYTGFGTTSHTAPAEDAPANPFTYISQYAEPGAGLYLHDRDYRPDLGRFTTADPAPRQATDAYTSAYAYAENLPTTLSDPSGRCPICISMGIGAVLGGVIEGGVYAYTTENTTWGGLARAAGTGAVIGAVGGAIMPGAGNLAARALSLTGGRALAMSAGVNAAVGAGFTWAANTIQCRPTGPTDLLFGALGGAAGSLMWGRFSPPGGALGANASAHRSATNAINGSRLIEEKPGGNTWVSDLSHVTGSTAASRNRAISAIINEDFRNLRFTYTPAYSPWVSSGIARHGQGTHIGAEPFVNRAELRNTLVHEELHHRWWSRGIYESHHPRDGSGLSERFYDTVRRYQNMRGW